MVCEIRRMKIVAYPEFGTKPGEWKLEGYKEIKEWLKDKDNASIAISKEGVIFVVACGT